MVWRRRRWRWLLEGHAPADSESAKPGGPLRRFFRSKLVASVEAACAVARTVSVVDSLGLRGGFMRRGRSQAELPPEEGRRTAVEKADVAGAALDLVAHIHAKVLEFARQNNVAELGPPLAALLKAREEGERELDARARQPM